MLPSELRETNAEYTPNTSLGVVLDLTAVDHVDSPGIHILYRLSESLRDRGLALRSVIPPRRAAGDVLRPAGVVTNPKPSTASTKASASWPRAGRRISSPGERHPRRAQALASSPCLSRRGPTWS